MSNAIIGFLIGLIVMAILEACGQSSLRDKALSSAVNSGYLVHKEKAYRVTLVEPAPKPTDCSEPTTVNGEVYPGSCPETFTSR